MTSWHGVSKWVLWLLISPALAGVVFGAEGSRAEGGPVLRWITVAPASFSGAGTGVSVLVTGPARESWILETAVDGRGSTDELPPAHREQVGDRVLTFFRFQSPGCGGRTLQIRVTRTDGSRCGSTRIPFALCGAGSRVLVPEWAPGSGEAGPWVPLDLSLDRTGVVTLSVVSAAGRVLRAWDPMLLPAGSAVLLWDGRAGDGKPVVPAGCRLRVVAAAAAPDLGTLAAPSSAPGR